MHIQKKLLGHLFLPLFLMLFSNASMAILADMSPGCQSCIRGYDCSRINKTCNATCTANLFSKQIDLDSCTGGCIGSLDKCLLEANKSCKFYCGDENHN